MSRKTVAVMIVLLLAGLAPATAIIGFCTRMPCCGHDEASAATPAHTAERGECCPTVTCYEAPSAQPARDSVALASPVLDMTALEGVAVPSTVMAIEREPADTSPPTTLLRI